MGGSNDPSNLIELTVEEHAEAHKKLYETYGKWEDYIAWKGLSRQIDGQELIRERISQSSKYHQNRLVKEGKHHLLGGHIQKKLVQDGKHHMLGGQIQKRLVEEGKHNFLGGEIQIRSNKKRVESGTHNFLGPDSNLSRLMSGTHPSQIKKVCEHCGKQFSISMHKRWHGPNCKHKK